MMLGAITNQMTHLKQAHLVLIFTCFKVINEMKVENV